MRLLLLNTDLEIGGTPTVVRELAMRLRWPRLHVEVACLAKWGPIADQIAAAKIPVTALGARHVTDLAVLPRLLRLIRQRRIDTIFSFLVHANTIAAAAHAICPHIRLIQSIQSTMPDPRWHWALHRLIHTAAGRMIVPSRAIADVAMRLSGIPRDKLVVIPNAIDPASFPLSPTPQQDPRPYPLGFIGRLDPIKRIPDPLAAVHRLAGLVRLEIFGYGPQEPLLRQQIRDLGIDSLVTLHGPVSSPQQALDKIGLLVLPSAAEGFGLVLLEAAAAGVPIVASDIPAIGEVVISGQSGLLVPPAHPEALANAIASLVNNRELRARMIANARARLEANFTWDYVLPMYHRVLSAEC